MVQWRVRPLGSFPTAFHDALLAGAGTHLLGRFAHQHTAAACQTDFRIFRFSVRASTNTEYKQAEARFLLRTRLRRDYGHAWKHWVVELVAKPSALSELENPEILE